MGECARETHSANSELKGLIMKITLSHGSGGNATSELIANVFAKAFSNPILNAMEDSALLSSSPKIALTTDSFVVTPLFFRGGDIGRLAVCGTVNDLLMRGAHPRYLTAAFIIETGAEIKILEKIAASMAEAANEAGTAIVAGDTKVIEGNGGIYINTTGVGFVDESTDISAANCKVGDAILLSGTLGDHHAALLSARMGIENNIMSDAAPLCEMVEAMLAEGIRVHALRDVTRGGLGSILNELADASSVQMRVQESALPVKGEVKAFCRLLGLDPLYMGNEGKLVAAVDSADAERALEIMHSTNYGADATLIGYIEEGEGVILRTKLGGERRVSVLYGEGLPRIC